jgi:catechol 2,3-dioxygenase-like lactoylglutathione lyase family enzyme
MIPNQITPFLHVPNLDAALEFFRETLPFKLRYRDGNYAVVVLDESSIRLLEEPDRVLTPDGKARVTVYIDVADVDGLHELLKERLTKLPPDRVEGPADQPWGQREFQVRLPDGDWLTFGQPIA